MTPIAAWEGVGGRGLCVLAGSACAQSQSESQCQFTSLACRFDSIDTRGTQASTLNGQTRGDADGQGGTFGHRDARVIVREEE